jgi:hypothetical protein
LPAHAPSQAGATLSEKSQGIQQSKDGPVTVVPKGRKEAADEEIKSEIKQESVNHLKGKLSTSHPQAVESGGAKEVPDNSTKVANGIASSNSSAPVQKPETYHTSEKLSVAQTTTEKPTVQLDQTEELSVSHTSTEKLSIDNIPTEKPTVQHIATEKPVSQEPPLSIIHPKATSQVSHVSDLRKDKLEPTVPEKAAEMLSHSEQPKSVYVKPLVSEVSNKVREDGTNHDTYVKQHKEVEESQKAQTTSREPDLTIQSPGEIPKEVPVVPDRISETRKNDLTTSASKYKKVMYYFLLLVTKA